MALNVGVEALFEKHNGLERSTGEMRGKIIV
jgi:hypothetical protein